MLSVHSKIRVLGLRLQTYQPRLVFNAVAWVSSPPMKDLEFLNRLYSTGFEKVEHRKKGPLGLSLQWILQQIDLSPSWLRQDNG